MEARSDCCLCHMSSLGRGDSQTHLFSKRQSGVAINQSSCQALKKAHDELLSAQTCNAKADLLILYFCSPRGATAVLGGPETMDRSLHPQHGSTSS